MKNFVTRAVFSVCLLGSLVPMQAAIINGRLNFTGDVRVSATSIDFFPPLGPPNGIVNLTNTQSGSFVGLEGTTARILDLSNPPYPPGVPLNVPGFLSTFSGFPGLTFTLNQILLGSLPGTPFSLSQTNGGTTVIFSVTGTVSDGTLSPASPFLGIFSSNFPGQTIADVLGQISSVGYVQDSFAATFVTTPEPGTAMSLISGGLLLGFGLRLRRKKA